MEFRVQQNRCTQYNNYYLYFTRYFHKYFVRQMEIISRLLIRFKYFNNRCIVVVSLLQTFQLYAYPYIRKIYCRISKALVFVNKIVFYKYHAIQFWNKKNLYIYYYDCVFILFLFAWHPNRFYYEIAFVIIIIIIPARKKSKTNLPYSPCIMHIKCVWCRKNNI